MMGASATLIVAKMVLCIGVPFDKYFFIGTQASFRAL